MRRNAILSCGFRRYNPQKHGKTRRLGDNARRPMKKSDFHSDLPPELVAQAPLPERSASRMLVVPPAPAGLRDGQVRDLPSFLRAGDLLVFNDTRVIPARLHG